MLKILSKSKKEVIFKVITSLFLQGLLLIIPIFWSNTINHLSDGDYRVSYILVVITLLLSLFYYVWAYLNQKSWYLFYNKIYMELTKSITRKKDVCNVSLGEYTNIINNDVDIVSTFFGNIVTRIIQVIEFLIIYIYFLSLNFYIFLVSLIVSILMVFLIVKFSDVTLIKNKERKVFLDIKSINIHKKYNTLLNNKKYNDNEMLNSSVEYLKSNSSFNIFVNGIIYIILSIIELTRYFVVIYGIFLVNSGNMEIGTILLVYSYFARMITNFEVLALINAEFQSVKVSLNRIKKIEC